MCSSCCGIIAIDVKHKNNWHSYSRTFLLVSYGPSQLDDPHCLNKPGWELAGFNL